MQCTMWSKSWKGEMLLAVNKQRDVVCFAHTLVSMVRNMDIDRGVLQM